MTSDDFDDFRPAPGVVRRLRVSSSVVRLLVLGLPLAAMTSVLAGSGRETAWAVPSSVSSANQAWLNAIVGPAPTVSPDEIPPADLAVVPLNGDPQLLVLPGPGQPGDTGGGRGASADSGPDTGGLMSNGIPRRVLQAYVAAAHQSARIDPSCHIEWSLLAGIGRVESDHGRFGGSHVTAAGEIAPPIYGPLLDGNGVGLVRDTDGGRLDGNASLDRAVGPMQFIPGTWAGFGTDANGDGVADPQNIDDAALTAARYLCAGGGDLSTQNGRFQAVFRYNGSTSYVRLVLALADSYATGKAVPVADEQSVSVASASSTSETSATGGSPPAVNPDTSTPSPSKTSTPTPTATSPRPTSSSPSPSGTPTPTRTTSSPSPTTTSSPSPTTTSSPSPTTPSPTSPSPTSSSPSPTHTQTPTPTTTSPTPSSTSPSSSTPSPTTSSSPSSSTTPSPSTPTTPAASASPSSSSADASPASSSPSTTS